MEDWTPLIEVYQNFGLARAELRLLAHSTEVQSPFLAIAA